MDINRICRACVGVSRPEGIARQGLFIESSSTEFGKRWFARLKIQRFDQVHNIIFGSRKMILKRFGVEFVVRRGPDRALESANIVAGYMVVFMSLLVMR
jgi:hypothetical protein